MADKTATASITLNKVGKRFRYEWIFKSIDHRFASGQHCAILGHNGSGKSTLMQILSASLSPSKGDIQFCINGQTLQADQWYRHIAWCAPYLELIEEFTFTELLTFQARFKPFIEGFSPQKIIQYAQLEAARNKEIRFFSSGMQQRVKLVTAILADVPVVLLDEPTTNLDKEGIAWYLEMVKQFGQDRLFIVASNQEREYTFCTDFFKIEDYK